MATYTITNNVIESQVVQSGFAAWRAIFSLDLEVTAALSADLKDLTYGFIHWDISPKGNLYVTRLVTPNLFPSAQLSADLYNLISGGSDFPIETEADILGYPSAQFRLDFNTIVTGTADLTGSNIKSAKGIPGHLGNPVALISFSLPPVKFSRSGAIFDQVNEVFWVICPYAPFQEVGIKPITVKAVLSDLIRRYVTISGTIEAEVIVEGEVYLAFESDPAVATSQLEGSFRCVRRIPDSSRIIEVEEISWGALAVTIPGILSAEAQFEGTLDLAWPPRSPGACFFTTGSRLVCPLETLVSFRKKLSLSITFDPGVLNLYNDALLMSKKDEWEIWHIADTKKIRVVLYSDYGDIETLDSDTSIVNRSTIHVTWNNGDLKLYIGKELDDSSISFVGDPFTSVQVTTNQLVIGGDANDPDPQYRGSVSQISFWSDLIVYDDIQTWVGPDGSDIPAKESSKILSWVSEDIIGGSDHKFTGWVEQKRSSAFFAFGNVYVQEHSTLKDPLEWDKWDCTLYNAGIGIANLTSEYALQAPFRIWDDGKIPPSILTVFRDHKTDITISIMFRKHTGTVSCTLIKLYGLRLVYDYQNKTLLLIKGDDQTNTLQNKLVHFDKLPNSIENGINVIVLRYNSFTDDADIVFNDIYLKPEPVGTNQYEVSTALQFADQLDFVSAFIIPVCLPREQMRMLQYVGYIKVFQVHWMDYPDYLLWPYSAMDEVEVFNHDPTYDRISIAFVYTTIMFIPPGVNLGAPYSVYEPIPINNNLPVVFENPAPFIRSVTVDANHLVTAIAVAGPTNAGSLAIWWEVDTGNNFVVIVADRIMNGVYFSRLRTQIDTFSVPFPMDWKNRKIRFVIQSILDPLQIWRSSWVIMSGDGFTNLPITQIVNILPENSINVELTLQPTEFKKINRGATVFRKRLKNKLIADDPRSRYKFTNMYTANGENNYELMKAASILVQGTLDSYTVTTSQAGYPDKIMVDVYGQGYEDMWWVVSYVNSMIDPVDELVEGTVISLPSKKALDDFISAHPAQTLYAES